MTSVQWLTHKESPMAAVTRPEDLSNNLDVVKARVSHKSYMALVWTLEKFGRTAERLGLTPLRAYSDEEIIRLADGTTHGLAKTSAYNVLSTLSRIIDRRFKWLRPKRVPCCTRRPLSEDEIHRLIHQCKPYWKVPVLVGLLCGLRIGDVINLRWCNVTEESITVRQQKTGTLVHIPMHPDLKKEFKKLTRPLDGNARVFTELLTKKGKLLSGTEAQYRFKVHAALPAGLEGITFHFLRYTFVSRLHETGCPLPAALALAGHCSTLIHLTYAKPTAAGLLKAIKHLPGINHKLLTESLLK